MSPIDVKCTFNYIYMYIHIYLSLQQLNTIESNGRLIHDSGTTQSQRACRESREDSTVWYCCQQRTHRSVKAETAVEEPTLMPKHERRECNIGVAHPKT